MEKKGYRGLDGGSGKPRWGLRRLGGINALMVRGGGRTVSRGGNAGDWVGKRGCRASEVGKRAVRESD